MADIRWIEDFVDLAETQSFSATANNRFVTQPTLSRHIKHLETWLGVSLFERNSRPVALTKEGAAFLPVAKEMVFWTKTARDKLRDNVDAEAEAGPPANDPMPSGEAASTPERPAEPAAPSPGAQGSAPPPQDSPTVLLVDDSMVSLIALGKQVVDAGYTVLKTTSPNEAMDMVFDHKPRLVLCDYKMPGMDGADFTRQIRFHEKHSGDERTAIIAVSTRTDLDTITRCFDAGMDDFLSKPTGKLELSVLLDRWAPLYPTVEAIERASLSAKAAQSGEGRDMSLVAQFCTDNSEMVTRIGEAIDTGNISSLPDDLAAIRDEAYMIGCYSFGRACVQMMESASNGVLHSLFEKRGPFLAEFVRLKRASQEGDVAAVA